MSRNDVFLVENDNEALVLLNMENEISLLFDQSDNHNTLLPINETLKQQADLGTNGIDKRKCKKTRKTKPSPVMKVDEETVANSSISENGLNSPAELDQNNSTSTEDESLLIHLVLSKILDRKKMELLDCDEVRQILMNKSLKK